MLKKVKQVITEIDLTNDGLSQEQLNVVGLLKTFISQRCEYLNEQLIQFDDVISSGF